MQSRETKTVMFMRGTLIIKHRSMKCYVLLLRLIFSNELEIEQYNFIRTAKVLISVHKKLSYSNQQLLM